MFSHDSNGKSLNETKIVWGSSIVQNMRKYKFALDSSESEGDCNVKVTGKVANDV